MKLLVATLFLSGVLSAPVVNQVSNSLEKPTTPECNLAATHFHAKKHLLYSYEGETITGIVGTSEERTGLKLRAKCRISPVLPCMYRLQISEVELLEGQGKNHDALDFELSLGSDNLSRELTAHDLYFESREGLITSIQPQVGEPVHVLNIKRGILSSLQLKLVNKDDSLTEVDVNGECSAEYEVKARHNSSRVKTILKSKDLSLCKDRSETNLGIPVTHYPTDKPFSLLKSNSLCKFVMSPKQRIARVSCEETHLFRPFSAGYNSSSGAMTTVRQKLKFISHGLSEKEPTMPGTEKLSLKYEHKKNPESTTKKTNEVQDILEKLSAEVGVKPDNARLFTKLIFAVRRLNMKGMQVVWYRQYECLERQSPCTKEQSKKKQTFIVDALSQCGTLDCAEFMVATMLSKNVSVAQSVAFLTGIALVGKPSEDMVGSILQFCKKIPSRSAFLTLGTLMHKFCSQHSCNNLQTRSSVHQAETFLRKKLPQDCQTSTPEEREVITLALKAIGNAGRPFTSVENILKCAVQPGPTAFNVDALQALRRMPCSERMTQYLLDIFDDLSVDTEIRIETYLALMRCPTTQVVQRIADILDTERNNQVGSFVWSHLTNALKSTEPVYGVPLRKAISEGLNGTKLRPFKLEHLRYSHAYEGSYYNKKYEFGGSSQAQVIFHPNSYYPRSAKLNFTVDVLGASMNLLETSARFEGFETLIEQMFGPEGYFPDENVMDLFKINLKGERNERSVGDNEMDEIKTNLKSLQDKMQIERKKPTGSLSLKLFGNELQFANFEDVEWLQSEADTINVIDSLISLARGGKVTYTTSFALLEADHEIPTALGFPLKLAVNGSGVSSVTLKGKLDIRNMFWGKKKFDIRGFVTPSANIEISGKMSVDAIHASSGIHVNTSLFTSTEINGNATYKEGERIKLSVEPPTKPVYVVSVKSNLATFLNERRKPITASPRRFEHKNCVNFTRFLGVNLCGHVAFPMAYRDYNASYFPLTGDTSFGLDLHATNPELARFELEARKQTSEDENRYDWIFSMHIPGITFGRKVVGNSTFQFLEDGKYLSVSCGIHNYRFGKFEAKYNNVSNRLHTKFSTPTMAYLKPITVETETFNTKNNDTGAREIGIAVNASYNNFIIHDMLSFYMHKDQYGLNSKFTYWPKKHITTETRFSLETRNIYMKVDDTGSKSMFSFSGNLGKSKSRFYAKIGNDLVKYGMKMNGELDMKTRKVLMNVATEPFGNLVKFEAYPRRNTLENGFHMRLSHVNTSSYVTGYFGSYYPKKELRLKFNGVFMKRPFLLRTSYYVRSSGRLLEWVAQGFGNNANASLEYSAKKWSNHSLELSGALNDKTINTGVFLKQRSVGAYFEINGQTENRKIVEADVEYVRSDEETTLRCSMNGLGHNISVAWSYYNHPTETGLKMIAQVSNNKGYLKRMQLQTGLFTLDDEMGLRVMADVLDKEFEAKWSILSGYRHGVRFVAMYMKKELSLQSVWRDYDNRKELRLDGTYNNKTISFINVYRFENTLRTLCSEITGLFVNRLGTCLEFKNIVGEKSLRITGEAWGRKKTMKAGWIHNKETKGAIFQTFSSDVKTSDFFVGLVSSPEYKGLRLNGTVKIKSVDVDVDVLLKYKNSRSLDLDLRYRGKLVTFKGMLVRNATSRRVQINVIREGKQVGSLFALLNNTPSSKVFIIGAKVMNYGAEYKLCLNTSESDTNISSMVIVYVNATQYNYGYSVSHRNLGTNGQTKHIVTTKLHYAKDKALTSTYQFLNKRTKEQKVLLSSRMELVPGQFIKNEVVYYKAERKLSMKHELLPGIGITYIAQVIDNDVKKGVESNLTILDYLMDSSVMYNKESENLTVKLKYYPVLPPVEFTKMKDGFTFNFSMPLSHWTNLISVKYLKNQLNLDLLVMSVPVTIFAEMLGNKQFIMNMTTAKPAFSAQLSGTKLNKDEYQILLKHEFFGSKFEDFKLTISSLQQLNKLRLRWESMSGTEVLENLNIMQKRLNVNLVSLETLRKTAREMANDTVNYVLTDGLDLLKAALNKSENPVLLLNELLRNIELNAIVEKYSALAIKLLNKMKVYGTPLVDTLNYTERMVEKISAKLSPHIKAFTSDLNKLLGRTVERYMNISIVGITVQGIVDVIWEKSQLNYTTVMENIVKQVKMLTTNGKDFHQSFLNLTMSAKKAVEHFTCNYDLKCTQRNVQVQLKKLVGGEIERVFEHLKPLTQKYRKLIRYTMMIVKETRFEEKVLLPTLDLLRTLVHTLITKFEHVVTRSGMMTYYLEMKQHKEILKALEDAKIYITWSVEELKILLKTIEAEAVAMFKMVLKLNAMSWEELHVFVKNGIEINYEKLREKIDKVRNSVMEKVMLVLERHASEIDELIKFGKIIYTTCKDIVNGNATAEDVKEKLELLLKKTLEYLKQKLRTVETVKLLKLKETATKAYYFVMEMYQNTSDHLWEKVTTLYPKVIEELKQLLVKKLNVAVKYLKLVKTKIVELRDKQHIYLKKAVAELMKQDEILVKKAYEVLENYKDYTFGFAKKMHSEFLKLVEKYEGKLEQTISEWKSNLTNFIEKAIVELNNTLRRYQHMPIEDIYLDLQLKASDAFDKLLGFIIGKTLFIYEEAMEKIKEMKEFYQRNTVMVVAEWKRIINFVQNLNENVTIYFQKKIQPILIACNKTLRTFGREVISASNVELWYEHVKYMKFEEFYYNVRDRLVKWNFNPKEYCEKIINALVEKVENVTAKLEDFIRKVKKVSKNVIERIERANEDVVRDTLETFEPHVKKVKNVLFEQLAPLTKNLSLLGEFMSATERYVKQVFQNESIKFGNLISQILKSIDESPFVQKMYSHKLWSGLKREFLDHELVVGVQELLKELSTNDCTYLLTKLLELKNVTVVRLEELGKYILGNKIIERIGEMRIYGIESKVRLELENLLAPVKSAYDDLSEFVVAGLLTLDIQYRITQKKIDNLCDYLRNQSQYIIKRFEVMTIEFNEWATREWTNSKTELRKLEYLPVDILAHLKNYMGYSMSVCWQLMDAFVPYKSILKMTPKQLVERLEELIAITEYSIQTSVGMLKELKDNVDRETVKELKETAENLFNYTRDQLHLLATEIIETTMFLTKFYGSSEIVYGTHPKMVGLLQYKNVKLQEVRESSRICMKKAIKLYTLARNIVKKLFAEASNAYYKKLPELVEFVKTEIKYLDTESLQKLHKITNVYLNMSSKFRVALDSWNNTLEEYLKSKLSEITAKLSECRDILKALLEIKIPKETDELYKKVRVLLKNTIKFAQNMYGTLFVDSLRFFDHLTNVMAKNLTGDFIDDIPTLVNNAITYVDMCKNDIIKLMNLALSKLQQRYDQDEVFLKVKKMNTEILNILEKNLRELKEKAVDVTNSVKNDIKKKLPVVKEKVLRIITIIREANITFVPGELELELPSLDEFHTNVSELKTLVVRKYNDVRAKFVELYQDCKNKSRKTLEQFNIKRTLNILTEDVSKFCDSSIQVVREKYMELHQKAQDFYDEKRSNLYNISKKIEQTVTDYVKMLLEESVVTSEKIDKIISGFMRETLLKFRELQSNVTKMNNEVVAAMKKNRYEVSKTVMTLLNLSKIEEYINKYIDVEDLRNMTKEIEKDLLNMTWLRDILELGESFYSEGQRLIDLYKDNREFSMYVMERIWKYSDVWDIVKELRNPFHWIPPYNSIAMVFGKPHVYTFDGQTYKFVGYKKPSCTYVLAHDFRDNSFTIMSQEKALIINTKSGFIKIHEGGKVEATVSKDAEGNKVKTTYSELPVEMMQMTVRREGSFIKVKHDTGLDIVCDLRHFFCTFNINKFFHGKLAGLLGTNNNEQYDEFLKPNRTIAESVIEFANAWEVSGDPECKVNAEVELTCEKTPSPRCEDLFVRDSSPFARYFKILDPKPFYDACLFDTSDCESRVPPSKSFCNVTAAYTALLREKGVWVRQLPECVSCRSISSWTERGNKNIDVVLLIPETLKLESHMLNLRRLLRGLEKDLHVHKYTTRFAVVGFGGKSAVHRRPHIVTGGGKIFGGIEDVQRAIKHMEFTAEEANAFQAIEYLGHLPFHPGATKVAIMVTDQVVKRCEAMAKAPLEKAMKELDMQGVIFNVIGPYFGKKHRNVLGMWKGQAMVRKDESQRKRAEIGLPVNDYTRLAEFSEGGVFNLNAHSKEHDDWTSLLKQTMKTTIVKQVDEVQRYCRQCVCVPRLMAEPITICRISKHATCS